MALETPLLDYDAVPVERIDCGDAVMALRRFGSGPALLLVHGFPLHGYTWRHLLPTLSRHYTCLVVDLAGLGDSEWDGRTVFDFDGHARRLKMLADRIGLTRYHLMAQDTGATTARCLALIDAERVARLVIFNTEIPGHRPPWIQLYQFLARHVPGTGLSFRVLLRSRLFLRSSMGLGGCFENPARLEGDFHARFVRPLIQSAQRTEGMMRYIDGITWETLDSLERKHAQLKMPVLLVWGEDDPTFPLALARNMLGQFPDARLVVIPRAKLLVYEEQPQEVLKAVEPFLAA